VNPSGWQNKNMSKTISPGVVHKVPADLRKALISDKAALAIWEDLTPLARNEWICWVTLVKKEDTRKEHVTRSLASIPVFSAHRRSAVNGDCIAIVHRRPLTAIAKEVCHLKNNLGINWYLRLELINLCGSYK
jgi:hypothetical protein